MRYDLDKDDVEEIDEEDTLDDDRSDPVDYNYLIKRVSGVSLCVAGAIGEYFRVPDAGFLIFIGAMSFL